MKDTPPEIDKKFRNMLLARSGEERLKMGCSMHAAARVLVPASIPEKDAVAVKRALSLRWDEVYKGVQTESNGVSLRASAVLEL
ncbi:MAG: hypothetical protein ACREQK_05390 [Candidatus Binatia bacterium]